MFRIEDSTSGFGTPEDAQNGPAGFGSKDSVSQNDITNVVHGGTSPMSPQQLESCDVCLVCHNRCGGRRIGDILQCRDASFSAGDRPLMNGAYAHVYGQCGCGRRHGEPAEAEFDTEVEPQSSTQSQVVASMAAGVDQVEAGTLNKPFESIREKAADEVRATALRACGLGLAVVPTAQDGTKRPALEEWRQYQAQRPTREEVERWFHREECRTGVGLICGTVSGLECLEFDDEAAYVHFKEAASQVGLGELVAHIETGYSEISPGGGVHWFYKVPQVKGNTKLARRPYESPETGERRIKPLIETRGEGGFVVIAPSCGKVHLSGKPYRQLSGDLASIAAISEEQRDALWELARSFDEMPVKQFKVPKAQIDRTSGLRPGDDYNARGDWAELLERHGWTRVYDRDDATNWRRPGKALGTSATTNHRGSDLLYVFSSSTPFEADRAYDKFAAYAILDHGGDFAAAAAALAQLGYGEQRPDASDDAPDSTQETADDALARWLANPPTPQPIRAELLEVPEFDERLLPDALQPWLTDIARRACCPVEFPAAGAIIVLATLVGRKLGIRPKRKDDWTVIPNLWGAIVGRPGVLKTSPVEEVMVPLKRFEAKAKEAYERDLNEATAKMLVQTARAKAAKESLEKACRSSKVADIDDDEVIDAGSQEEHLNKLAQEVMSGQSPVRVPRRRYIVKDATPEKLLEIMGDNPQGVLYWRDEIIGFLRTLEKPGREGERAIHLEAWPGDGHHMSDRIMRGTTDAPLCESIFGSIQPGPLSSYIRKAADGNSEDNDGLISRFQVLLYPDLPERWINIDEYPDAEAKERALQIMDALKDLRPESVGAYTDQYKEIPFLRFSPEAQKLFDEWRTDLENHKLRNPREQPLIEAHLAKYRSLMPSLALLFHLVDLVDQGIPSRNTSGATYPVSLDAARRAAAWCDFFEAHVRRIYRMSFDHDPRAALLLAERVSSLPNPFTVRDVTQHDWSSLDRPEAVNGALGILERLSWVYRHTKSAGPRGGRPTVEFHLNPNVSGGASES